MDGKDLEAKLGWTLEETGGGCVCERGICCWKPAVSGFPWLLLRVFLLPLLPREGISPPQKGRRYLVFGP